MTWPVAAVLIVAMICATAGFVLKPIPRGLLSRVAEHTQEIAELKRLLESVRTKITFKP